MQPSSLIILLNSKTLFTQITVPNHQLLHLNNTMNLPNRMIIRRSQHRTSCTVALEDALVLPLVLLDALELGSSRDEQHHLDDHHDDGTTEASDHSLQPANATPRQQKSTSQGDHHAVEQPASPSSRSP